MGQASKIDNFSYATEGDPPLKRLLIQSIERVTGQPHLKRLYEEHQGRPISGENFWAAAIRLLEVTVAHDDEALRQIPQSGPLVIVANHPFGVLDGLIVSYLTSKIRDDFLVLTNSVLYRAEEIRPYLLPVDFAESKEALATNLRSRAQSKAHLAKGGCLIVFPAGGASTAPKPWSRIAVDTEWKTFTAGLIAGTKAPVLPVFFAGQNSRLFQIFSHISLTLRLALFFKEVYDKIGAKIHVRIGTVIPYKDLEGMDRKSLMDHLRKTTYALGAGTSHRIVRARPSHVPNSPLPR